MSDELATTTKLADAVDASVEKTLDAQAYTLRDGTSVTRPTLSAQMDARQRLIAEKQARTRRGLFVRLGFSRR